MKKVCVNCKYSTITFQQVAAYRVGGMHFVYMCYNPEILSNIVYTAKFANNTLFDLACGAMRSSELAFEPKDTPLYLEEEELT